MSVSATYTTPASSAATKMGPFSAAAVPTPLLYDAAPVPTCVVTMPPAVTRRTALLDVSHTYSTPLFHVAPLGPEKRATVPCPSTNPATEPALPACVETTPPGTVATRTLLSAVSTCRVGGGRGQ